MRAVPALAGVTVAIWTTRISNIVRGDEAAGAKAVSAVLAVVFTAFAVLTVVRWWRRSPALAATVRAFAGWTVAVWVVRLAGIATADHGAAFVVVHAVLAAVSVTLAVAAAREVGARARTSVPA